MLLPRLAAPILLTLCLIFSTACSAGRPVRQQRGDADSYHISRSELERSRLPTMFDLIQQIRPLWLTNGNDASVAVYLNEQLMGGVANLRRISVHLTEEVRYMSATEAQVRFGQTNGLRPAILVTIRR